MKSHRLRLLDLLLFEDFDDLLLLDVDVPPYLPFDTLEVSASSDSGKENYNSGNLHCWTKSVGTFLPTGHPRRGFEPSFFVKRQRKLRIKIC